MNNEVAKVDSAKVDAAKVDSTKVDSAKVDTAKVQRAEASSSGVQSFCLCISWFHRGPNIWQITLGNVVVHTRV